MKFVSKGSALKSELQEQSLLEGAGLLVPKTLGPEE